MTVTKHLSGRVIGVFALAMINVAAIASLRALPSMAEYGLASAFFYIIAVFIFLIPTSLVAAELATGWPKRGGVFVWVREALGQRWGFMAIWLQWIQNVVWYPTALSFTAATLAYVVNPELAANPIYTVGIILLVYWGATLANFRGMKTSGKITSIGVVSGTIVPGLLIIIFAVLWFLGGDPIQMDISWDAFFPDMSSMQNIALAAGVVLAFAGMEMSAVHAQEVKDPQRDYPKAILIATTIILVVMILGTLAVSMVVPQKQISLVAGVMEAFTDYLDMYNLAWLIPVVAVLITFGVIAQIVTWIGGPSKGILTTAHYGELPPFFQKVNKNGVQVNILFVQGCVVTLLSLMFLLMPDVSSSYWILSALTAQLYLIMYLLMFVSAIKLRYSAPNVERPYKIPGGNFGMWIVAGIGLLASVFGIALGFFPPSQLDTGSVLFYHAFLVCGIFILAGAPLLIHHFRKPGWVRKEESPAVAAAPKKKPRRKKRR
jgi:putative glutamate/gamma-aminobutyrate antiporter